MSAHQAWLGAVLLAIVWLNTFAQMVPLHGRLALDWDAVAYRNVVRWNLVRTLAWSA